MALQVVTANRLNDGVVVYLTRGSGWSERVGEGAVGVGVEAVNGLLATAMASAGASAVVDPYVIEVIAEDRAFRPARRREWIRAMGPTIRSGMAPRSAKG